MTPNKNANELSDDQKDETPWWASIVFTIVACIWLIAKWAGASSDSIDSFFSALAFAGVIITLVLQRKELQLQRKELQDTRKVLEHQREQLEAHTEAFNKQNFESTFFSLLDMHHTMVNAISHNFGPFGTMGSPGPGELTQGRDCFEQFYFQLKGHHDILIQNNMAPNDPRVIDLAYGRLYNAYQSSIGQYFRHLYNIVRFVKDSNIDNKVFYIRLIRAQLSVFELSLLFYNCLSPLGREKFKPLIEEFALFKTVKGEHLINPAHRHYYAPSAFELPPSASTL